MYLLSTYLQTSDHRGEIIRGLAEAVRVIQPSLALCAVSYASLIGCRHLNQQLRVSSPTWDQASKHWLVGLDSGITEPQSLEYLAGLPNSALRLFDAAYLLENGLQPRQKFHTKLYAFESEDTESLGVFSSSANLTFSGLFLNTEQAAAMIICPPLGDQEQELLHSLRTQQAAMQQLFEHSIAYSPRSLERYRALRAHVHQAVANEDHGTISRILSSANPELHLHQAAAMALADHFWVEVRYVVPNLGIGRSGNQIDLQRGSRVYFGMDVEVVERNTFLGAITIICNGISKQCNMRFGNNSMDKLNLPPPADIGVESYENKVLLFSRIAPGVFELQVLPIRALTAQRRRSDQAGGLYALRGGREYGIY